MKASLILLTSCLVFAGCTLERRDGGSAEEEGDSVVVLPVNESEHATELARQTVRLFRDATSLGDISRALSLLEVGAAVIDPLAGRSSESMPVGEVLLELRRRHAEGMSFEATESSVSLLPGGSALVLTIFSVVEGEARPGTESGQVYETALLTPSDDGWKIVHIHRSLATP